MPNLPPVLYRGSVKNIRGEVSAESLLFEFSDRYSVFDWGEMPDQIEGKGRALSIMGKAFFSYLEKAQNWTELFESKIIKSTFSNDYLKKLESSATYKNFCEAGLKHHAILDDQSIEFNSELLKVKKVSILKPGLINQVYQYDAYNNRPAKTLVPLEIIFRIGLPPGNSLTKRLGNDLLKWREFGLNEIPKSDVLLENVLIDFSTKLERGDRYLSYAEAKKIAALNEIEWNNLHDMTHLIALNLFLIHHQMGLELWDGKIEVAFSEDKNGFRSFILVDSIGIDELRLLYKKKSFSKEFLRESYKESKWYENLELSKKESLETGIDFKEICSVKYHSSPLPLDPEVKLRAEAVYKSYCNALYSVMKNSVSKKYFQNDLPFDKEFTLLNYNQRYL